MCRLVLITKFEAFSAVVSSNLLSGFLSHPCSWNTRYVCDGVPQVLRLCSLFFILYCVSDWIISIDLYSGHWLFGFFFFSAQIFCWVPLVVFFILVIIFLNSRTSISFFVKNNFYLFISIFYLGRYHSPFFLFFFPL